MIADGLRIVMLGAPGAGKGTQAQRMVSHFGIPQISTGEIFRENLKRNTPLGREIKEFMEKGELVPDDIVLKSSRSASVTETVPRGLFWTVFRELSVRQRPLTGMWTSVAL